MKERDFPTKVDRYLRREDTIIARALKTLFPPEGQKYRESMTKRVFETVIATPLALLTLPLVGTLAAIVKIEDGGTIFYIQDRLSQKGVFPLIKIRCMHKDADSDVWANIHNAKVYGEENDPRNTKVGRFMRQYELEELPQLWQVMSGQLKLIDIRANAQYASDYIKGKRTKTFDEWAKAYFVGQPGLFSLNSAVNPRRKDDTTRHHYDLLYAHRASLGLDLFILYRTAIRMSAKLIKRLT